MFVREHTPVIVLFLDFELANVPVGLRDQESRWATRAMRLIYKKIALTAKPPKKPQDP